MILKICDETAGAQKCDVRREFELKLRSEH